MNNEFEKCLTFVEDGQEVQYNVDSYFEMDGKKYVFLSSKDKSNIMSIEETEDYRYLTEISDNEVKKIFDAYQTSIQNDLNQ